MNWGMRIVVGLGAFMLFIVGAGIYMVTHDSDTLLDDDYYEKGLAYDEVYDRKQNLLDDHAKPVVRMEKDTLVLVFNQAVNRGQLVFKRPSDGALDTKIPFYTDTDIFRLPLSTFAKGSWSLEISWEHKNKTYIDTQSLYIQ